MQSAPRGPPSPGEKFHKYDLHFRFERPDLGIEAYESQIKLNADGTLFEEIDLPPFRAQPEKLRLIALTVAQEIATRYGVAPPFWRIDLGYSVEREAIFWRFVKQTSGSRLGGKLFNLEISAHDGTVLKTFENDYMR